MIQGKKLRQAFDPKMIPKSVRRLEKRQVKIRGYTLPTSVFREKGNTQFVLARSVLWNSGIGLTDELIVIRMAKGHAVDFKVRPIDVQGTFHIKLLKDPLHKNEYIAFYEMTHAKVAKE